MLKKIMTAFLLALVLTGCSRQVNIVYGQTYIAGQYGKVVAASASQIQELIDEKYTFVVYIGQSDCDSCQQYQETLKQVVDDYDIVILYMPSDDANEADQTQKLIDEVFTGLAYTPTTYLIRDGQVIDSREKTLDYQQLTDWLLEQSFLSKAGEAQ